MRRPVTPLFVAALLAVAAFAPTTARAQCDEPSACLLPHGNCGYLLIGPIIYPPTPVEVRNITMTSFSQCMPPQPPSFPIDSFFDVFVTLEISGNGGGSWQPAQGTAHGHEHAVGRADGITFDTEMVQLDLSGGSLPPGVRIRESPAQPSIGVTQITPNGGGSFHIDSFFDIFTELSVDGGASWTPSDGPSHTTVTVERPTRVRASTWGAVKVLYR